MRPNTHRSAASVADHDAPHNPVRDGSLLVTAALVAAVPAALFAAAAPAVVATVAAGLLVGWLLG